MAPPEGVHLILSHSASPNGFSTSPFMRSAQKGGRQEKNSLRSVGMTGDAEEALSPLEKAQNHA